jgi:hypothetical protein
MATPTAEEAGCMTVFEVFADIEAGLYDEEEGGDADGCSPYGCRSGQADLTAGGEH